MYRDTRHDPKLVIHFIYLSLNIIIRGEGETEREKGRARDSFLNWHNTAQHKTPEQPNRNNLRFIAIP